MFRVDTAGSVSCPLSKLLCIYYISNMTTNTHPRVHWACQVKHVCVKGSVRFMNKTKLFKWTIGQDGMLSFGWQHRKVDWHLAQLDWEPEHLSPPEMWWNSTTIERACIVVFWEPKCCVFPFSIFFFCYFLFKSAVQGSFIRSYFRTHN